MHKKCLVTSYRERNFPWFPQNYIFCIRQVLNGSPSYIVHRCGASGSMRACHAAGPGSFPGRDKFRGWGYFRGFSSPVRQMSGNFRPTNIIWPSSSSFHIRLVGMTWVCAWCVLSFMFVLSWRWPRHWADHSSGEVLHVLVWSKKSVCDL